jgi:hypothetical protein
MFAYPRSFAGQFVIGAPDDLPEFPKGETHRLNALSVRLIGEVSLVRVYDASDRLIGAFLGHAIDYRAGGILGDAWKVEEACPDASGLDAFLERVIYRFGGSYLFILDDGQRRRVYLDAGGTMSAVFDDQRPLCGATAGTLLSETDYSDRFRAELFEHLRVMDDGWFPAGLTAHQGITRLLANHYYDFDDGRQHRHWPRGAIEAAADPDLACRTINEVTASTIKALLAKGSVACTLTAGNDSRLVLAGCRDEKNALRHFTVEGGDQLDAIVASKLARALGLNHSLLSIVYADEDGMAQWQARCGHCIGGANLKTFPTIEPLARFAYFCGGVGGEAGRGFFWRPLDTESTELTGHGLAARLGMPIHDEVVRALDAWLEGLPAGLDTYQRLDLGFLEHRLSAWACVQSYATTEVLHIHPLVGRETFVAMLSLPPEWRRTNGMVRRCMELAWPELLALPINKYGDYRDLARPVVRALRDPHLILKKLRKRFG